MKVITISASCHSLEFTLLEMSDESVICTGVFERIGLDGSCYMIQFGKETIREELESLNYLQAVSILVDKLVTLNIIQDYYDIEAVGYKIPFGYDIRESVFLSQEIISQLQNYSWRDSMKEVLAVIDAFQNILPDIDKIGVFDTSFYVDLPEDVYLYGIPYQWYSNYGIRKYGFQGISHQYVMKKMQELFNKDNFKLISCCLDSEGSISAIKNGKCVNTSMGFTSLTGIVMSTRSGDVDPSIIPLIMEKEGKNVGEVLADLTHSSGLLGLSENSSDMHDIITMCSQNDSKALLAKKCYVQRVVDYIAQYYVLLQGIDVLAFTGFISENFPTIINDICERLSFLGIRISTQETAISKKDCKLNKEDSSVKVYVIANQESLMIAREVLKLKSR